MSSLMVGSSVAISTRSGVLNSPCSTGGDAASASGNNSANGRTGSMWKTSVGSCAARAPAASSKMLSNVAQRLTFIVSPSTFLHWQSFEDFHGRRQCHALLARETRKGGGEHIDAPFASASHQAHTCGCGDDIGLAPIARILGA